MIDRTTTADGFGAHRIGFVADFSCDQSHSHKTSSTAIIDLQMYKLYRTVEFGLEIIRSNKTSHSFLFVSLRETHFSSPIVKCISQTILLNIPGYNSQSELPEVGISVHQVL